VQETRLSEATLSRYLNRLMIEGVVHKIPTVYSLSDQIKVIRPTETRILLVKDIKRVKRGDTKDTRVKIVPLETVSKKRN
jgi:hypothetical protein